MPNTDLDYKMQNESSTNIRMKAKDVDNAILNIQLKIPQKDRLMALLGENAPSILPVKRISAPDITISAGIEEFRHFIQAYRIHNVMYRYDYYDEQVLDSLFRMPDSFKNLFDERSYKNYLFYASYVRDILKEFAPDCPRMLSLYVIYQGYVIAYTNEDDWIKRTGLPNVRSITQAASDTRKYGHYEQGIIQFHFTNLNAPTKAVNSEPFPKTQSEQQADPDEFYRRILSNIEIGRPPKKRKP